MILSDDYLTHALEADLQSEYGVDIGQYWRREIPIRRFLNLVAMLPDGSRVKRAMTQSPDGVTVTDQLLITAINEMRQFVYMWHTSQLGKGQAKPAKPDMIEFPDPATLAQSTLDKLEKAKQAAESAKWDDYEFGDIGDIARLLGG